MEKLNKKLSPKAQEVLNQLSVRERREIQKDNPFRGNRNKKIRELRAKGVAFEILAEITGFNRGSIYWIVKKRPV